MKFSMQKEVYSLLPRSVEISGEGVGNWRAVFCAF